MSRAVLYSVITVACWAEGFPRPICRKDEVKCALFEYCVQRSPRVQQRGDATYRNSDPSSVLFRLICSGGIDGRRKQIDDGRERSFIEFMNLEQTIL